MLIVDWLYVARLTDVATVNVVPPVLSVALAASNGVVPTLPV